MLQVPEAFGLAATTKQVACACAKGVVRLFASKSLQFKANLPYLSPQGVLKTRLTHTKKDKVYFCALLCRTHMPA